jgi:hypothetical protein
VASLALQKQKGSADPTPVRSQFAEVPRFDEPLESEHIRMVDADASETGLSGTPVEAKSLKSSARPERFDLNYPLFPQ